MIVMLAAAAVMLPAVPADHDRVEGLKPFVRMARAGHCPDAGRLQTSLAEPALLYRPQDANAARLRKLIDLPEGKMCLVGAVPAREDHRK